MVWDREDGRTTVESYWDSSMSIRSWRVAIPKDFSCQWIPRQNLRAEAERLHPSYTLWVGMDMTERPTQDFEKNGWSGIGRTEGPGWNPIGSSMSIRSWRVAIPKDFSCQWIPRQKRAEAERLHPSYTLWVGMDMTERPTDAAHQRAH